MKPKQGTMKMSLWIVLALAWIAVAPAAAFGQKKERPVLPKPVATKIDPNAAQLGVIVLKFREGTAIRLRDDQWAPPFSRPLDEQRLLQRANLDEEQVQRELGLANTLLQNNTNLGVARLFTRPEAELDREKQLGEQNSQQELADLNLYYHLFLDNATPEDTEALIDQLNALHIVEIAYPQPIYFLPQADLPASPGPTPSFVSRFLFSVGPQFIAELDNGQVSPALRAQFESQGWPLSQPISVEVVQTGGEWRIFDAYTTSSGGFFSVQNEGGTLNVYFRAQGYLEVANSPGAPRSNGIDARYAWTLAGGRGQGMRMIDVENDWRDGHEDLPGVFYSSGQRGVRSSDPAVQLADRNHGTAVLGEVVGVENTFGITGIAPQTAIGFSAAMRQVCNPPPCRNVYDLADAVNRAAGQLQAGDIILIEQQVSGPTGLASCDSSCDCCSMCGPGQSSQFGMIPVEWDQATFDAIQHASGSSLIVVEPAGNGQMNLDDARYNRAFDRTFRDSGAIMVGAGTSNTRAPMCFTNSGNRVDVQGWGQRVVTTGYGDLFGSAQGLPETRWYTTSFGGTSSASPIVTGAAAAVQGVRRTRGLPVLNAVLMGSLLRETGVTQAAGRQIGPLPNLRDAIALYVDINFTRDLRLGIPDFPYRTLAEAMNAAWNNAQIKMMAGSYQGSMLSQPMILMSRGGTVTISP